MKRVTVLGNHCRVSAESPRSRATSPADTSIAMATGSGQLLDWLDRHDTAT
jgi:hypothetical protein